MVILLSSSLPSSPPITPLLRHVSDRTQRSGPEMTASDSSVWESSLRETWDMSRLTGLFSCILHKSFRQRNNQRKVGNALFFCLATGVKYGSPERQDGKKIPGDTFSKSVLNIFLCGDDLRTGKKKKVVLDSHVPLFWFLFLLLATRGCSVQLPHVPNRTKSIYIFFLHSRNTVC